MRVLSGRGTAWVTGASRWGVDLMPNRARRVRLGIGVTMLVFVCGRRCPRSSVSVGPESVRERLLVGASAKQLVR